MRDSCNYPKGRVYERLFLYITNCTNPFLTIQHLVILEDRPHFDSKITKSGIVQFLHAIAQKLFAIFIQYQLMNLIYRVYLTDIEIVQSRIVIQDKLKKGRKTVWISRIECGWVIVWNVEYTITFCGFNLNRMDSYLGRTKRISAHSRWITSLNA